MKHPRCNREPERQEPSRNKLRAGVKCGFSRKGDRREDRSVIYRQGDMGKRAYPETQELLITADAGGSNAARSRVRKLELQRFAGRTGITVSVSHFPPGTSKWNKIPVCQRRVSCRCPRVATALQCRRARCWRRTSTTAHSGSYSAELGSGAPTSGDSSVSQIINVGPSGGTLSLWYWVTCPDTVQYDWFTASLQTTQGVVLATLVPKTCVASSGWTQVTYNLAAYAGQTIVLVNTNHDDNYVGDPTYTLLDDVSIQ